jgi:RNA 3'-terminal phosphate cyclase (ATP)
MAEPLLNIDGSHGEGGGQILRSSLALSIVTGRPFVIENIRARRKKPGLMRQHLAAVAAAAEVGRAEVEGAAVGSLRLTFRPSSIRPGDYRFDVGSAGSTTLVLQTVLPALMIADGNSTLTLEGGTHNPFAPPFDFLEKSYLPLVNRLGPNVEAQLERPGFYPVGGGCFTVKVKPAAQLGRLELTERGEITARRVRAIVANLPRHIAERECHLIAVKAGWDESCFEIDEVKNAPGPGNVVMIEIESVVVTEVFVGFGRLGVRAEKVAFEAFEQAFTYLLSGMPVGKYLADQIVLLMGIAAYHGTGGGVFRTAPLSDHATTHLDVLRQFMDLRIDVADKGARGVVVMIG